MLIFLSIIGLLSSYVHYRRVSDRNRAERFIKAARIRNRLPTAEPVPARSFFFQHRDAPVWMNRADGDVR